jgi:uncharacterized protein (DUF2235 family)
VAKNIVIFSDGTGFDGGSGINSNVYRLFNMIEDRTPRQIAFYDRGVGTGVRKISGNLSGMGISKNIRDCYRFIFEHFESGDRIFLFGFSRGATTVRSLASFMQLFGVLPKSRPELIRKAYRIYRTRNHKRRRSRAEAFVARHHTMWCNVEFLGVWDTVAALGIPLHILDVLLDRIPIFRHKFQDLTLSECVIHARHAMAIDERRVTFSPTYWTKDANDRQTIKQVWFAGVHTDVGGGYRKAGLSDLVLGWMVREARSKGLYIYPRHRVRLSPDPMGEIHDSRRGVFRFARARTRSWDDEASGKAVVHRSVIERRDRSHSSGPAGYEPWILDHPFNVEDY